MDGLIKKANRKAVAALKEKIKCSDKRVVTFSGSKRYIDSRKQR